MSAGYSKDCNGLGVGLQLQKPGLCYSFGRGNLILKQFSLKPLTGSLNQRSRLAKRLILVVVAGFMLVSGWLVARQSKPKNYVPMTSYASRDQNYRISYPKSWHDGSLDQGKVGEIKNGIFVSSLAITTNLKTNKPFEDFISQNLKTKISSVRDKYRLFEVTAESHFSFRGRPAYYLETVTRQTEEVNTDRTVILYIDLGQGKLAALVMGVDENEWEKNPTAYRQVVASLDLKT